MHAKILRGADAPWFSTSERCDIAEWSNLDADPALSIAHARVAPGVTTRWHRLAGTAERYVILQGTGRVEVGELPPTDVAPGDVVIIPPNCRQRIANTGAGDLLFLALCTPRFRVEAYEDIDASPADEPGDGEPGDDGAPVVHGPASARSDAIFHLSLPVDSLDAAREFYCDLLGAPLGRQSAEWIDVLLFGHQLTLHARPEEVQAPDAQGVRHFGASLPWAAWQALVARLEARDVEFVMPPAIAHAGTSREQGKCLLRDPSGHLVEIKAYRDPAGLFGVPLG